MVGERKGVKGYSPRREWMGCVCKMTYSGGAEAAAAVLLWRYVLWKLQQ